MNDQTSVAPILDDAEWALLRIIDDRAMEPLGVAAEDDPVEEAAVRTGFDAPRLREALATLRSKHVLVGFGEGAVQITRLGRDLLAAQRV